MNERGAAGSLPGRPKAEESTKIVVVGPCAAGKSTLVETLQVRGYDAHVSGQEHSAIASLWQHPTRTSSSPWKSISPPYGPAVAAIGPNGCTISRCSGCGTPPRRRTWRSTRRISIRLVSSTASWPICPPDPADERQFAEKNRPGRLFAAPPIPVASRSARSRLRISNTSSRSCRGGVASSKRWRSAAASGIAEQTV